MLNRGTEQSPIRVEISSSIAVLQFCRPEQRNPLSIHTLDKLAEIFGSLKQNSSIHVIIVTGSDDVFLSGADIRELARLDPAQAVAFSEKGQALTSDIAEFKGTTIAAINGFCMGGGLDLALACNIRIASRSAVFAHPGARLGIITGWGGTQRLARLVGKAKAIELFATAKRLESEEALRIGLVSKIKDPVLDAAIDLASKLAFTS